MRAKLIFNPGSGQLASHPCSSWISSACSCYAVDIPAAIAILSNPQANEMHLAAWLRFPRVRQLGVNLEQ